MTAKRRIMGLIEDTMTQVLIVRNDNERLVAPVYLVVDQTLHYRVAVQT
ncbi:hypothetical protein PR002_g33084 [Phytophthora rubi]|uniref:Uncharacterized protein n=1 Tax=Phytophthora rubi TaxID=129364 RepID=A0A6A3GAS5_9STRA|nr:hypothetical protein PR002_g33084 [Phytophthora rubi]